MTHAEIIEMLQILLDNAKVGCADITAIHHVSFDSFKFVIEQTIKALSQEPKSGKWIPMQYVLDYETDAECSLCHEQFIAAMNYKYCPNCGAKMENAE